MAGTSSSGMASMSWRSLAGGPNPCHSRIGGRVTFGGILNNAGTVPVVFR
jgi:hypothetical protein